MTFKFYIIDYSILGFQHLIYVLECIYIIILYQYGQLVTLPNKFSTISLFSKLSNTQRSLLIRYIQRTLKHMPNSRLKVIPFTLYILPAGNGISDRIEIILMTIDEQVVYAFKKSKIKKPQFPRANQINYCIHLPQSLKSDHKKYSLFEL